MPNAVRAERANPYIHASKSIRKPSQEIGSCYNNKRGTKSGMGFSKITYGMMIRCPQFFFLNGKFVMAVCECSRAMRNVEFSLLLKTDDDCYINVDEVLMKIDYKSLMRSNLWWGK